MGRGASNNATVAAAATKASAAATQFSHTAAAAAAQLQTATAAAAQSAAQSAASAASTLAHAAAEKAHEGKQVVVDAIKKDGFVAAAKRGNAKALVKCFADLTAEDKSVPGKHFDEPDANGQTPLFLACIQV